MAHNKEHDDYEEAISKGDKLEYKLKEKRSHSFDPESLNDLDYIEDLRDVKSDYELIANHNHHFLNEDNEEEVQDAHQPEEQANAKSLFMKLKKINMIKGESCGYAFKITKDSKFIKHSTELNALLAKKVL